MALLSKSAIFKAIPVCRDVEIAEWGGTIRVRPYSLIDRIEMLDVDTVNGQAVLEYERDQALPDDERAGVEEVKRLDTVILEIIYSCVDAKGARIFDIADHDRIRGLSAATLTAVLMVIRDVNEVQPTDLKKSSD